MKEFNLEEAKAGKPVCTRIGLPVRIVCFDAACGVGAPILALVKQFGMNEQPMLFHTDGKAAGDCSPTYDLFMASEKHEGWGWLNKCAQVYNTEEEALSHKPDYGVEVFLTKVTWEE